MAYIQKRPFKCSDNSTNFYSPEDITTTYTENDNHYTYLNTTSGSSVLYYYDFTDIPSNAVITEIITTVRYDFIGTISFRLCKDSTGHSSGQYTSIHNSAITVYSNDSNYKSATEEFSAPSEAITAINSDLGILRTKERFSLRLYGKLAKTSSFSHNRIYSVKVKVVYSVNRTITTSVSPSGSGTVTGGGTYTDGSSVTLTATPATGYKFVKWQKNGVDDGNTSASRTITVSDDATYTAVFAENNYTISTSVSPTGAGTVSGAGTYASGASATLTATPAAGYHFTSWSDGNTNASRTVTVQSSVSYTANFALNTYSITKSLSHATLSNSVTTAQHGSSYSSTVTADTNYTIDTVTIIMGGTDITSSVYSNGQISITSVTGNLTISVTTTYSRLPEIASVLCEPNPVNAGQGIVLTVVFS